MSPRHEQNPMRVRIADLPEDRHIELSNEFVRTALEGDPMRQALERPADDPQAGQAEVDLSFYAEGANVFARGTIRGWGEVACSRCVTAVRIPFDGTVSASFLPREHVPEPGESTTDDEVELAEDDLDLYPYDGDEIDLEPLLREHLILAVPYAPLCTEACKGLCPQCGTDLNLSTCQCEAPIDPRLAALKNLKL